MDMQVNKMANHTYHTITDGNRTNEYSAPVEISNENLEPATIQAQEKRILEAIEKANGKFDEGEKEFKFSVHQETKQIMVKIIDKSTKDIILEVPSEKILDMVADMCERAGLFIDIKR